MEDVEKKKRSTKVDASKAVKEYIDKEDWRINANANTGYSHAGMINNLAGKLIANYWLDEVYSKEEGDAHRNGDFHIHDLDNLAPYCCGHDFQKLLDEGFNGVQGRPNSKPAKHFREALYQLANYFGILQAEWAGAQAVSSFDTYLAPYVFFDMNVGNLTYDDIKKSMRNFIYNLNVPSRWGQSPFTNITIDWTVPNFMKDLPPSRNGKNYFESIIEEWKNKPDKNPTSIYVACAKRLEEIDPETYKMIKGYDSGDNILFSVLTYRFFQKEMNIINRAFYEILNEGDTLGQPFTFPIPTINITEDFDWNGENTDLLFENTAKYGSSYFQNFIGSQYMIDENGNKVRDPNAYSPNDVRSMCCRLQLDKRQLRRRRGGLFGSDSKTRSCRVVTMNCARLGYLHKGDKKGLYERFDYLCDLAKSTLEKKRKVVTELLERGLYPYTRRYIGSFDTFFSTIGVNGINEMIRNFTNDEHDITDEYGQKFASDFLDHLRARLVTYQEETGNLYNAEASPGERTTRRFAHTDKKKYPKIIQAGFSGGVPYYTNSSQLPVEFTADPFTALDLQDNLQRKYNGRTVIHLYMRERISSVDVCKKLVRAVLTNYRLPYISVTPTFSVCPKHGRIEGEHEFCPKCDAELIARHAKEIDEGI